jgi:hypothetical protein
VKIPKRIKTNNGIAMRKTVIMLATFALFLGGCKNQSKNSSCIPISEKHFDSVETQFINDRLNESEMDTTNWIKFKSKYSFSTFNTEIFKGKLAPLDFTGSELDPDKQKDEWTSNYMKYYVDFWMKNDEGITSIFSTSVIFLYFYRCFKNESKIYI